MAVVKRNVPMNTTGKAKKRIRENHQPLKKAKKRPEKLIAKES